MLFDFFLKAVLKANHSSQLHKLESQIPVKLPKAGRVHSSGQQVCSPGSRRENSRAGLGWGFLLTVFMVEFKLLCLKVNTSTGFHEAHQPSLFSKDLKTQPPGEHSAWPTFTMSQCLLTSQTHPNGNVKSLTKTAHV